MALSSYVCNLLANLDEEMEEDGAVIRIPIMGEDFSYKTMEQVVIWCQRHVNDSIDVNSDARDLHVDAWDKEFITELDTESLRSLILAANFLDIKPLLDVCWKVIAGIFRGKSPREVILAFNPKC